MNQLTHILHLEDDPADAELIQATLESAGIVCQITRVQNRDEFTQALQQGGYDLILADYRLPAYDGMSALQLAQELRPDLPFIFVSGTMGEDAAIDGFTQGATDYVLKQKLSRLVPAVERALREAENRQERQRAEEALRESEGRYRLLAENASDIIFTMDIDFHFTYISPSVTRMRGYTVEEAMAQTIIEVLTPASLEMAMNVFQEVLKTEAKDPKNSVQTRTLALEENCKDGSTVWTETTFTLLRNAQDQPIGLLGITRDITERKQVEEALHLQSTTLEAAANGIVITDRQGTILWVNPAFTQLTGYSATEAIGQNPRILKSGMQAPAFYQNLWNTILSGQVWHSDEVINRRKDGALYMEEMTITPVQQTPGGISRFIAIKQDVTERKRTEEALRAKVAALQMLSDIGQAIISSLDLDRMLLTLLEEVREATGAEACSVALIEQVSGDLVFRQAVGGAAQGVIGLRLPPGEGLAGWVAQHRQSVLVPDAAVDARVRILADSSGFVTRDLIGVPLIARDKVTGVIELINKRSGIFDEDDCHLLESVAAQAAVAIENAHLLEGTQQALKEVNALYRINQSLVVSLDPQELLQDVVELLQKSFDYYHVQVYVVEPGTGDLIMRAGSGEIGMKLKEKKHRLHAGGGIVGYTAEMGTPFFTNDVDKVHFFIRNPLLPNTKSELAVPVKIEGRILGVLDIQQVPPGYLTHHDIQLVSAVADQLAIALQKANLYSDLQASLKMEQAMRLQMVQSERLTVMGRLLASVSHELNNPLQAIQNALFLLREETGISAQGKQDLDIVLSESERMAALISRLRANYRSTQMEDFQPAQINHIIEGVYALIATHLRHNEISFEFQPDPELPEIPGLTDQLRQVLLNLLMNAVEAMPTGGRLTVSTQCLAESHEVLIKVSDTGAGIHPAILPNIFDAFVTDKEHGTGLGLTITYDIITKHRGRIQAENNPQGGATFSVWLPCRNGESE